MKTNRHLVRLESGVESWNEWREEHPDIVPDLRGVSLLGADLRDANLSNANLSGADLSGADLHDSDLNGAILSGAKLYGASLNGANLYGVNLHGADLYGANLSNLKFARSSLEYANLSTVDLSGADLHGANLSSANLSSADLSNADFHEANLAGANLESADLSNIDLSDADLHGANLSSAKLAGANLNSADLHDAILQRINLSSANVSGANLHSADLRDAVCSNADFRNADLREATLIGTRLEGADLTAAKLWETQRAGWSIKNVSCQRAFWDESGREPTEYGGGDFERIYAEKMRIVLRYPGGISPIDLAMLPLMVERLQAKHPNCTLHIRSVQDDGNGAAVTITVEDLRGRSSETFKTEAEAMRVELLDYQNRLRLSEETRLRLEAKYQEVKENFCSIMDKALKMSKYEIHGPVGAVGDNATARDFQQIWVQSGINDSELAKQLKRLHKAMNAEHKRTPEQIKDIAIVKEANDAASNGDGPIAMQCLKAVGKWTLDLAEKIGVDLVVKAIEKATM
jgi:uncharacterized protein YjbI with pentapeptide repeats